MRTNFTPGDPAEDDKRITAREWLDRKDATGSPKDEDIAKYRDRDYPNWTRQCRRILSDLHKELQREVGQPIFKIAVTNEGTRPGNDALVVIKKLGNFEICPPPYKNKVDEDSEEELALPRPPRPPVGPQAPSPLRLYFRDSRFAESVNLLQRTMNPLHTEPILLPRPIMPHQQRRDPTGSSTNLTGHLSRESHSLSNANSGATALAENPFGAKFSSITKKKKFVEH